MPVLQAPGLRQGRVREAGVSPAEKDARLCPRRDSSDYPFRLVTNSPERGCCRMSQVGSSSPGAQHGKRKCADPFQGAGQLGGGVLSCLRRTPESLRTTFSALAQLGEREAGTRALFIGAQPRRFLVPSSTRRLGGKGGEGVQ